MSSPLYIRTKPWIWEACWKKCTQASHFCKAVILLHLRQCKGWEAFSSHISYPNPKPLTSHILSVSVPSKDTLTHAIDASQILTSACCRLGFSWSKEFSPPTQWRATQNRCPRSLGLQDPYPLGLTAIVRDTTGRTRQELQGSPSTALVGFGSSCLWQRGLTSPFRSLRR